MTTISFVKEDTEVIAKTDFEKRRLKKKPDNYRLACQTMVNGSVKIITKPKPAKKKK